MIMHRWYCGQRICSESAETGKTQCEIDYPCYYYRANAYWGIKFFEPNGGFQPLNINAVRNGTPVGVPFTLDGVTHVTPFSNEVPEGSHTIIVPQEVEV